VVELYELIGGKACCLGERQFTNAMRSCTSCWSILVFMRKLDIGTCEHCSQTFGYYLIHSGFNDSSYAYCDTCGMTTILSSYDKRMPKLPSSCLPHSEICAEMESYLKPCECTGVFKKGSCPRCPRCRERLSAETATSYLERNAPGTKEGWHWQENWHETYCIVIEDRVVHGNFVS
jgi:hypothetical protein